MHLLCLKLNNMKKAFLVPAVSLILGYSCSKIDHNPIIVPPPPPSSSTLPTLIEYPIDLNFNINASCRIWYDDGAGYAPMEERDFEFHAYSIANLRNDTPGTYINVFQVYGLYSKSYSVPVFNVYTKAQNDGNSNYFEITPDSPDFNFFTLPYQNGSASFSGACHVTKRPAQYVSGVIPKPKLMPLNFSGFVDTIHHTGSMRLQGSLYY